MSGTSKARRCREKTKFAAQCTLNQGQKCTGCQQLLKVEARLEEARAAVASLEKQRESLYGTINESHDSFTHRFPIEICTMIFQLALPLSGNVGRTDMTLSLSQVCRSWRSIAVSTPKLWTSLYIDIPSRPNAKVLAEILARSRPHPISLEIDCCHTEDIEMYMLLMEVIKNNVARCTSLEVGGQAYNVQAILRNCGSPVLEDLRISRVIYYPHINTGYPPLDYPSLPKPYRIDIEDYKLSFYQIPIQWTNLTSFSGALYRYTDVFDILNRARCLESFTVTFGEGFDDAFASDVVPDITHPNLSYLEFNCTKYNHEDTDYRTFFRKLTLPKLSQLGLWGTLQQQVMLEGFDQFLERSGCQIETFRLCHGSALDVDMDWLLGLMPAVKIFWMCDQNIGFVEKFVKRLADTRSYPSTVSIPKRFLPMLEEVNIRILHFEEDKWISESLITDVFAPESPLPGLVYRPLSSFHLQRCLTPQVVVRKFFDMGTVQTIKKLQLIGHKINVLSGCEGSKKEGTRGVYRDFVQQSLEWHETKTSKLEGSGEFGSVEENI